VIEDSSDLSGVHKAMWKLLAWEEGSLDKVAPAVATNGWKKLNFARDAHHESRISNRSSLGSLVVDVRLWPVEEVRGVPKIIKGRLHDYRRTDLKAQIVDERDMAVRPSEAGPDDFVLPTCVTILERQARMLGLGWNTTIGK